MFSSRNKKNYLSIILNTSSYLELWYIETFNPIALGRAKPPWSFGHSEYNRFHKHPTFVFF